MSVRERDFEVVVISWEEKEANSVIRVCCWEDGEEERKEEEKESSDNRVISGFLFFCFVQYTTPFIVRLFDFVLVHRVKRFHGHNHRELYTVIYIYTRGKAWKSDIAHCYKREKSLS